MLITTIDSSREFYSRIIGTRNYEDRLQTTHAVREAGIGLCSGGIFGMGENAEDRLKLLAQLASMSPPPESVPINLLIPVPGTPLENQGSAGKPPLDPMELVRLIAVARTLMSRIFDGSVIEKFVSRFPGDRRRLPPCSRN